VTAPRHDAFISYSHAVDGRLAAVLESGLERLAKPMFRLRAMDVFRDQTSLAASPGLWAGIVEHLTGSRWFVLMASPASAASAWCHKEVVWWLEHRDASTVLVVLTEGEIVWDGSARDFDWSRTTALSPALKGRFGDEPLYVDLRWARSLDRLSAGDPRLRGAVLDVAAPIRGVPKDELDGEDVRQLRRARVWRRAAVTAIAIAALVAVWQAVEATRQRDVARRQRDLALARQLAAQASALRVSEPVVALLLAAQAHAVLPSAEASTTLLRVLKAAPLEKIVEHSERLLSLAVARGTDSVVAGDGAGATLRLDVTNGRVETLVPAPAASFLQGKTAMAVSPDGRSLAAGGHANRLTLWREGGARQELETAHETEERSRDSFIVSLAFSPDGRWLASAATSGLVLLHDLTAGTVKTLENAEAGMTRVAFSPDGRVLAAGGDSGNVRIFGLRDRTRVLLGDCGRRFVEGLAFSSDGTDLFCATSDAVIQVFAIPSRKRKERIDAYAHGELRTLAMSPVGDTFITGHANGAIVRWQRTGPAAGWSGEEVYRHAAEVQSASYLADSRRFVSLGFDGRLFVSRPLGWPALVTQRWRSATTFWEARLASEAGHIILSTKDGTVVAALRSGDVVRVVPRLAEPPAKPVETQRLIASHADREAFADPGGKLRVIRAGAARTAVEMQGSHGRFITSGVFSPDGRTLYAMHDEFLHAWNVETGAPRAEPLRIGGGIVAASPDGRLLAVTTPAPLDLTGLTRSGRGPRVALIRAADLTPVVRDLEMMWGHNDREVGPPFFTPDGRVLVTNAGSMFTLWDVVSRQRIEEVLRLPQGAGPLGFAAGAAELVVAVPATGAILTVDVNAGAWAQSACRLAGRSLTGAEWNRYVSQELTYAPACEGGRFVR
jgi:WD40 repeat protein